jgi:hypothetical protein
MVVSMVLFAAVCGVAVVKISSVALALESKSFGEGASGISHAHIHFGLALLIARSVAFHLTDEVSSLMYLKHLKTKYRSWMRLSHSKL